MNGTMRLLNFRNTNQRRFYGLTPLLAGLFLMICLMACNEDTQKSKTSSDTSNSDTTLPTVSFVSPSDSEFVSSAVNVVANASDDHGVAGVTFKLDDAAISTEDTVAPYVVTWDSANTSNGTHTLTAVARDSAGNNSSASIAVNVNNPIDNSAPTAPRNVTGIAVSATQINLTWTASTDNVQVTGYRIYSDGVVVATTTTTNHTFMGLVESTTYSYNVTAYDASGNESRVSSLVVVTTPAVVDMDNESPIILFSNPTNNATVADTITVTADASDNVGVVGVQFKLDGADLSNEDTSAPYSVSWDSFQASNGTHMLMAIARDAAGNSASTSITVTVSNVSDTQAPTKPGNLTATAITPSQVNLSWAASTDNIAVTGYRVYRNSIQIATSTTTNYTNTGLTPSTVYSYTVVAYDAAGNLSPQSDSAAVTTPSLDSSAPTVSVTNPLGGDTVTGTVSVSAAASDNIGVVGVQFKLESNNLSTEDTSAPYTVSWDTTTVTNGSYTLTAVARDAAGNSNSNSITVTVSNLSDVLPPTVPNNLTATAVSTSQINLSWNASSDDTAVTGYRVYRDGTQIATTAATTYSNSGLAAATSYSYKIAAYDAAGNVSAQTSAVTATTDSSGSGYSTTFSATENPIDEGGNWVNGKAVGIDWNNVQTIPGRAYASVLSGNPNRYNDSIAHLSGAYNADQFAQGTVYRDASYNPGTSKHEVELLLRFDISANYARGYEILWGVSGYLAVVRWNGPLGNYTALYDTGDPGIGPAVDGDVLRAEISGNIVKVYKNSVLKATVDITSKGGTVWSTGKPGMGFWPVDGAILDKFGWKNFQAGNL